MDDMKYIRSRISTGEALAQLAEEAAELAQAALKLRRVLDGTNPTPVRQREAIDHVAEEIGDVLLCARVAYFNPDSREIRDAVRRKKMRWAWRLRDAQKVVDGG